MLAAGVLPLYVTVLSGADDVEWHEAAAVTSHVECSAYIRVECLHAPLQPRPIEDVQLVNRLLVDRVDGEAGARLRVPSLPPCYWCGG